MIQPEDIREKAERIYPTFLKAWLDGDEAFFPRVIPCNKALDDSSPSRAAAEVQRLRNGSSDVLGFGYTVQWEERQSRTFGLNQFPARIVFETQEDLLRFLNRRSEFAVFSDAVTRLRDEFPILSDWIRSHRRLLIDSANDLEGLLHVLRYFREHPRPIRFARELPIPVDTKFIERHERVLRDWFDLVLPPDAIRSDERLFARRYGLRYADTHWLVRLLDPTVQAELGFPCAEFSLPLQTLANLTPHDIRVLIVENKINLLTLPPLPRTLALGGVGSAITDLRDVSWLRSAPICYWGDIDVEGFAILSALRVLFHQTRSLFMDESTLDAWINFVVPGTGEHPECPTNLSPGEIRAFAGCRERNLRLEQERIPHEAILVRLGAANPPAVDS